MAAAAKFICVIYRASFFPSLMEIFNKQERLRESSLDGDKFCGRFSLSNSV